MLRNAKFRAVRDMYIDKHVSTAIAVHDSAGAIPPPIIAKHSLSLLSFSLDREPKVNRKSGRFLGPRRFAPPRGNGSN